MNSHVTPLKRQRVIAVGSWLTAARSRADPAIVLARTRPLLDWLEEADSEDDAFAIVGALEQQQSNCRADPSARAAQAAGDLSVDSDWFLGAAQLLYAGATGDTAPVR